MAHRSWSVQDAENRFSEVIDAATREPQTVTEHGKPAVVVMAAEEYERLHRLEILNAPSFPDHLLAMPTDDGNSNIETSLREPARHLLDTNVLSKQRHC